MEPHDQETMFLGVPKNIYEILEDTLEAQIRRLGFDIAKTLHVDPKLLLKEFKKDKIKAYLFEDDSDIQVRCKSYIKKKLAERDIYIPCEDPIVYRRGGYCINHLDKSIDPPEEGEKWSIVYHATTKYYRDIKNIVYTLEGIAFGIYISKAQEIEKFIID